jgi:hypothetical protein
MASLAGISRGSHAAFFIARRALEAGGAGGRRPGKQATRRRFIAIECATDETELADPPLDHHVVTYPYGATQNLRLAIDAAGVALWSWNVDNDKADDGRTGLPPVGRPNQRVRDVRRFVLAHPSGGSDARRIRRDPRDLRCVRDRFRIHGRGSGMFSRAGTRRGRRDVAASSSARRRVSSGWRGIVHL